MSAKLKKCGMITIPVIIFMLFALLIVFSHSPKNDIVIVLGMSARSSAAGTLVLQSGIFPFLDSWAEWQRILLYAGAAVLLLIIIALIIRGAVLRRRKKKETEFLRSAEKTQDIGKMTLEFASEIFKAANPQYTAVSKHASKHDVSGQNKIAPVTMAPPVMPITFVMPAPAPTPAAVHVQVPQYQPYYQPQYQPYFQPQYMAPQYQPQYQQIQQVPQVPVQTLPYTAAPQNMPFQPSVAMPDPSAPEAAVSAPDYSVHETLPEPDHRLTKKEFKAYLPGIIEDEILIERIYDEKYRPKKYKRKKFFRDGELTDELIKKEKKRIYKKYKKGEKLLDAVKSQKQRDAENEAALECSFETRFGYAAENTAACQDVNVLNSRRKEIVEARNAEASEVNAAAAALPQLIAAENKAASDLVSEKNNLAALGKKDKKAKRLIKNAIRDLDGEYYNCLKNRSEKESFISHKKAFIEECDTALKKIDSFFAGERPAFRASVPSASSASSYKEVPLTVYDPSVNSVKVPLKGADEYDSVAAEIARYEDECVKIVKRMIQVDEAFETAPENARPRLSEYRKELAARLEKYNVRLEKLRASTLEKIISAKETEMAGSASGAAQNPAQEQIMNRLREIAAIRRYLRDTRTEKEALAMVDRLYEIKYSLADFERADADVNQLIERALRDAVHAAELNRYRQVLNSYKRTQSRKRRYR